MPKKGEWLKREDASWVRKLGRTIKLYRNRRGLTLQKAANNMGITLRSWQRIEAGLPVSVKTLLNVAKALGVPAWKLLKG